MRRPGRAGRTLHSFSVSGRDSVNNERGPSGPRRGLSKVMAVEAMEMERLEALLSTWSGKKTMVRVPLVGSSYLAFYGELKCQYDNDDDPQFLIYRDGAPTIVFYIKDVSMVHHMAGVIDLKSC